MEGWLLGSEVKSSPPSVLEQSMEQMVRLMEGQQRQISELQQMVVKQQKKFSKPRVIRVKPAASGLKAGRTSESKAEFKPVSVQEPERVDPLQVRASGKKAHMYNLRERGEVRGVEVMDDSISEKEGDYSGETLSSEDSVEEEEYSEYEKSEASISVVTALRWARKAVEMGKETEGTEESRSSAESRPVPVAQPQDLPPG